MLPKDADLEAEHFTTHLTTSVGLLITQTTLHSKTHFGTHCTKTLRPRLVHGLRQKPSGMH